MTKRPHSWIETLRKLGLTRTTKKPPTHRKARFETLESRQLLAGVDIGIVQPYATEGAYASFTITLSPSQSEEVVVHYETQAGTATSSVDFAYLAGSVTFSAGETSKQVLIQTIDDSEAEGDETFSLKLTGASGASVGIATAVATIVDNDDSGSSFGPQVSIDGTSVTEGTGGSPNSAVFTVTLSSAHSQDVVVDYQTQNGTAEAGTDYTSMSGSVTISAGYTSATIAVPITPDSVDEPDETFSVMLTGVSSGDASISQATAVATILDDDDSGSSSGPQVSIDGTSVTEGTGGSPNSAVFTVTLSSAHSQDVVVNYQTQNGTAEAGTDYTSMSGSVTISAGYTSATIAVPITPDSVDEPDETFSVMLTGVSSGDASISQATAVATILDDDDSLPSVSVEVDRATISESSVNDGATFTIRRTDSDGDLTVYYQLAGNATRGDDYTGPSQGYILIPDGQPSAAFTVYPIDDAEVDPGESIAFDLAGGNYHVNGSSAFALVTIDDNDSAAPQLSIDGASVTEGTGGSPNSAVFTVTLSSAHSQDVVVNYQTQNGTAEAGTDYTSMSGSVTISAGYTSATIAVPITPDSVNEPDETFSVYLTGTSGGASIGQDIGIGTIANDDPLPSVTIDNASVSEGTGSPHSATFAVSLSHSTTEDITITYYTIPGTATSGKDYTYQSGSVTISAGQTTAIITVSITPDSVYEPDETFSVILSGSSANAIVADDIGQATITNDDDPPLVSLVGSSAAEGTDVTFTVTLSEPSEIPVTVHLNTVDGTATASNDYDPVAQSITFSPGDVSKTIKVSTNDDSLNESVETLSLSITSVTNASVVSGSTVGSIIDNSAPIGADDSYSILLNQPFETESDDGVLANDIDLDGDAVTATIVVAPEHATHFTLNSDGTFEYTPVTDFIGEDTFTYKVQDSSGVYSDEVTVNINVAEVVVRVDFRHDVDTPFFVISDTATPTTHTRHISQTIQVDVEVEGPSNSDLSDLAIHIDIPEIGVYAWEDVGRTIAADFSGYTPVSTTTSVYKKTFYVDTDGNPGTVSVNARLLDMSPYLQDPLQEPVEIHSDVRTAVFKSLGLDKQLLKAGEFAHDKVLDGADAAADLAMDHLALLIEYYRLEARASTNDPSEWERIDTTAARMGDLIRGKAREWATPLADAAKDDAEFVVESVLNDAGIRLPIMQGAKTTAEIPDGWVNDFEIKFKLEEFLKEDFLDVLKNDIHHKRTNNVEAYLRDNSGKFLDRLTWKRQLYRDGKLRMSTEVGIVQFPDDITNVERFKFGQTVNYYHPLGGELQIQLEHIPSDPANGGNPSSNLSIGVGISY